MASRKFVRLVKNTNRTYRLHVDTSIGDGQSAQWTQSIWFWAATLLIVSNFQFSLQAYLCHPARDILVSFEAVFRYVTQLFGGSVAWHPQETGDISKMTKLPKLPLNYSDPSPSADIRARENRFAQANYDEFCFEKQHPWSNWLEHIERLYETNQSSTKIYQTMKILVKTFICAQSFYEPSMPRNQKTQSCQKLLPESSITNENKTCIKIHVQSHLSTKAVLGTWKISHYREMAILGR